MYTQLNFNCLSHNLDHLPTTNLKWFLVLTVVVRIEQRRTEIYHIHGGVFKSSVAEQALLMASMEHSAVLLHVCYSNPLHFCPKSTLLGSWLTKVVLSSLLQYFGLFPVLLDWTVLSFKGRKYLNNMQSLHLLF